MCPVHRLHGRGAQAEDHLRQDQGRGGGKLAKALSDRHGGLVFDDEGLTLGKYLDKWLEGSLRGAVRQSTFDRYEKPSGYI